MKLVIVLPQELDWVTAELESVLERAQAEVAAGSRPEYSAGYFQAARDITEALERSYESLLQARRGNVRQMKPDA